MNRALFPHQARALELLRQSLASGKRRPMLQAPTGAGKTILAAAIVDGALRKGKQVVVTVPALSLIDQTVSRFAEEGITDVGVIQAQHVLTDSFAPVQIASIQTLCNRPLPIADIVLVDEAHRVFDFYATWMAMPEWQSVPFVGLSATPWTRGLGKLYDDMLITTTTSELIQSGHLSPFRVFAPAHPDLSSVRTVAGDFHEGELAEAMSAGSLVADIVTTWRERAEGRPTLCYAVDRAHAKKIQVQFEAAGIRCGYVDAYTDMQARARLARHFHAGEVRVVASVGTMTTGIDWDVRCIILARPTKSEMLFTQIIGRGLRTADGKSDCLILDHSDTHLRLGFVTDLHHETLDDGKSRVNAKRDARSLPKECAKCHYVKAPKVHACPACGEVQSKVRVEDGELRELTADLNGASPAEKQTWFSMLLHVQHDRGYRHGWAANQYRQKFGVWPRALREIPTAPSAEVLGYVKSSLIRFAKRRAAA